MKREILISTLAILILTVISVIDHIIVKEAVKKPLDIPINTALHSNHSEEFKIIYPGEYSLEIVLENKDPESYHEIKNIIGSGGYNKLTGEPTGKYKEYTIGWKVNSGDILLSGTGSHLTRGGSTSRRLIAKTIGVVTLPKGTSVLQVDFRTDLSELLKYNPRLVLDPGAPGAGTSQSSFTGTAISLYYLVQIVFAPLIIVLVIRLMYLYARRWL